MARILCRISSDYIGAGSFVVSRDRIIVGTDYGLQCLARDGAKGLEWKRQLGSRCVGVVALEDGTVIAACLNGLYALTGDGKQRWGTHSFTEIVHGPVGYRGGVLLTSRDALHYVREWNTAGWRFDFPDVLGSSVDAVRLVNLFGLDPFIVVGAVDYDSGIGRVLVLHGRSGRRVWMSEPGPLSELFPAGRDTFGWCQMGYGKFETRLTGLDGRELWRRERAGVGALRHDGALAMVIGSNESPTWDDWEYCEISPAGHVARSLRARGRCLTRPVSLPDGSVYFVGNAMTGPTGSGADETRFDTMPQETVFQHLMGIRSQLPEYDLYLQRVPPGESPVEVVYERSRTCSLADIRVVGHEIFFFDGQEILAIAA